MPWQSSFGFLVGYLSDMSNRDWANTSELEDLIAKALANGADEWIVSGEIRTRAFLAEKERLQGRLQFVEAELKLTEISIQSGLQPGGSRGFVFNLVNGMKGVSIDGFVQRIHICDLKVVLRGTEGDAQYVMAALRNLVNCDIEEIRYESFHAWPISPNTPNFKILKSASIDWSETSDEHITSDEHGCAETYFPDADENRTPRDSIATHSTGIPSRSSSVKSES